MDILIAGGAGFIGSHLSKYLLKEGDSITIVDDLSSGRLSNIEKIRDGVKFTRSDISNFNTKGNFDVIVNLASRASWVEWETYPVEVALSNSTGNNNPIKLALHCDANYIFVSTSEVYGTRLMDKSPGIYN